jgi:hypothetical protein
MRKEGDVSTTYTFSFKIANFDGNGEEHRFTTSPTELKQGDGLGRAIRSLVEFAARLLRCKPEEVAASRIHIKSAWMRYFVPKKGIKQTRVTTQQLVGIMTTEFAPKGRGPGHVDRKPMKPFDREVAQKQEDRTRQRQRRQGGSKWQGRKQ